MSGAPVAVSSGVTAEIAQSLQPVTPADSEGSTEENTNAGEMEAQIAAVREKIKLALVDISSLIQQLPEDQRAPHQASLSSLAEIFQQAEEEPNPGLGQQLFNLNHILSALQGNYAMVKQALVDTNDDSTEHADAGENTPQEIPADPSVAGYEEFHVSDDEYAAYTIEEEQPPSNTTLLTDIVFPPGGDNLLVADSIAVDNSSAETLKPGAYNINEGESDLGGLFNNFTLNSGENVISSARLHIMDGATADRNFRLRLYGSRGGQWLLNPANPGTISINGNPVTRISLARVTRPRPPAQQQGPRYEVTFTYTGRNPKTGRNESMEKIWVFYTTPNPPTPRGGKASGVDLPDWDFTQSSEYAAYMNAAAPEENDESTLTAWNETTPGTEPEPAYSAPS